MRVRCIFAQRSSRYPGEYAPELLDAWSEFVLDDNPMGYAEVLQREQSRVGTEYDAVRELDIIIQDSVIDEMFTIPVTPAEVDE